MGEYVQVLANLGAKRVMRSKFYDIFVDNKIVDDLCFPLLCMEG